MVSTLIPQDCSGIAGSKQATKLASRIYCLQWCGPLNVISVIPQTETLHITNKTPFSVRKADRQASSNTVSLQPRCLHTTPETGQLPSQ